MDSISVDRFTNVFIIRNTLKSLTMIKTRFNNVQFYYYSNNLCKQ